MALSFGKSERGKPTVIYRGFEYWKKKENVSGTISWRCHQFQRLNCKATLVTSGNRVVSDRQPDHTHEGNPSKSMARTAVAVMKEVMTQPLATPSSSQAAVSAGLGDHILMALPNRSIVARTLQRHRLKVNGAANGDELMWGWID